MAQEWSEEKLFEYYQNTFKPIYGDLVAVIGNKPLQISFETEAMLSHISVAKTHLDPQIIKSNISKAGGHLERATLDAVKILWLEYRNRSRLVIDDELISKYCTLIPEHEFITRYNGAESLVIEARKKEIQNVGINPKESVMNYYEAANEFHNLHNTIDWGRVKSIEKFRLAYIIKQHAIGFIVGVLSSAFVAILTWKYLPSQPLVQVPEKPSVPISNKSK